MYRLPLTGCEVDVDRRIVYRNGHTARLTTREAELLQYLAARPGAAISRGELLQEVWGYGPQTITRAVDDTMKRLRPKVEADPKNPVHLITVHGAGYRFEPISGAEQTVVPPIRRSNLTGEANRFVGRRAELAQIASLFERSRLVSLLGPGGTGKTRLARQYGRQQQDRLSGGVWFIDLSAARSTHDILREAAATLGLEAGSIASSIAERGPALYIIDNFEQVAERGPDTVGAWLAAGPDAQFLVTTRERLRIAGEAILDLRPLKPTEAVELFAERALDVDADLDVDEEIAGEIVNRVDCLPLAVELAAARVGLLGLRGLLDRLSDRFQILGGTQRGVSSRHETLWDTIDWSWQLLDAQEQQALMQCAVFRGGFTIEAAEAIVQIEGDTLQAMQALLDKSMLKKMPGGNRLGLYESIRSFAQAKLTATDLSEAALERHAAWYLTWAEAVTDDATVDQIATRGPEAENLLAALERSTDPERRARLVLALDPVLQARGPFVPRMKMLECLELDPLDPTLAARILLRRAEVRAATGRPQESRRDLEQALAWTDSESPSLRAYVMSHLGVLAQMTGDLDEALAWTRRGLTIPDMRPSVHRLLESNLAATHLARGSLDDAEGLLRNLCRITRPIKRRRLAVNQLNLAAVLHARGQLDEADEMLITAIDVFRELSEARSIVPISNLALSAIERGDLDAADQPLPEARKWADRSNQAYLVARVHRIDGIVSLFRGQFGDAIEAFAQASDAFEAAAWPVEIWAVQIWLSVAHVLSGERNTSLPRLSTLIEQAPSELAMHLANAARAVLAASRGDDPPPLTGLDSASPDPYARLMLQLARSL